MISMDGTEQTLKIFLCHASEDKQAVRNLYKRLRSESWLDVWLDEVSLLPGQNWELEIEKALDEADAVLVCISTHSVGKEGYIQKELHYVLRREQEKPQGTIFLIPVRLDPCDVPRPLRHLYWGDPFGEGGYERLVHALQKRAAQLKVPVPDGKSPSKTDTRAERLDLQPKKQLTLGGTTYLVQRLTSSQSLGNMIIKSAHASSQAMQEDVSLLQISFLGRQEDVGGQLERANRRAQILNEATGQSTQLPVIKNFFQQKEQQNLWVIGRWVRGHPLSKYYPADGPLPGVADLGQILGWAADLCDALAPLHKLREVYGGFTEQSILIQKGRGAILADPVFAGQPLLWKSAPARFDARVDLLALGDLLHRLLTHQADSREPARRFNDQVPAQLEALVMKMQTGPVGQVPDVKRDLLRIRKEIRP
jgi:hypothetical protein